MITIYSKAKINLFLHVIGKNETNYHLLESLVAFTDKLYDIINVFESKDLVLEIQGPYAHKLSTQDNIILKAANLLRQNQNLGARIILTKNIPVEAGLGGGSSNAAATLKLLSKLWNIDIDDKLISNLQKLGADVPCCYHEKAAFFSGIGEIIEPIENFPNIYALLVNPNKSISTASIFNKLNIDYSKTIKDKFKNFDSDKDLIRFLSNNKNDMEENAIKFVPEIANIIKILKSQKDCQIARMSGSGSTCFGLFTTEEAVKNAYSNIKGKFDWWVSHSMIS